MFSNIQPFINMFHKQCHSFSSFKSFLSLCHCSIYTSYSICHQLMSPLDECLAFKNALKWALCHPMGMQPAQACWECVLGTQEAIQHSLPDYSHTSSWLPYLGAPICPGLRRITGRLRRGLLRFHFLYKHFLFFQLEGIWWGSSTWCCDVCFERLPIGCLLAADVDMIDEV